MAVTNAGVIPDRGLYGVFVAEEADRGRSRRVGELDEEMVFEARVGEVLLDFYGTYTGFPVRNRRREP